MTAILPRRPRRTTRHETARTLRERAIAAGVDPFVAGTTPADDLRAVIAAAPTLRLVDDVETPDVPRLGARRLTWAEQMEAEGFTPDEVASVRTFARGELVATTFASADDRTPWDERGGDYYDGGDAA